MSNHGIPTILVAQFNCASEGLVKTLQQQGYMVLRAEDASQALEVVRVHSRRIHIMLTEDTPDNRRLAGTLKLYRPNMQVVFLTRCATVGSVDRVDPETALVQVREMLESMEKLERELTDKPPRRGPAVVLTRASGAS